MKEAALSRSSKASLGGRGVEIQIHKRIPVSAGLGGGSSNAASVLLGLNRLWKLGWSRRKLAVLGGRIGSDVPFFVREASFAVGRGRGERITPVSSKRRLWHVVVKPSFGVSTRSAYTEYARLNRAKPGSLTPPRGGVRILVRYLQNREPKSFQGDLFNSLELALNKRVKRISKIKNALLKNGATASLLSGSGSAVFGVFDQEAKARQAAGRLARQRLGKIFVAKTF